MQRLDRILLLRLLVIFALILTVVTLSAVLSQAARLTDEVLRTGMSLSEFGGLILLIVPKMAELVTDSDLLEIEQDPHILRVERANNFALSCDLDEVQVVHSLLGAERCWWDGQQWHFSVRLPDGLSIEHRFSVSEDSRSLAQRTVLAAPGVNRDLEVVRIYSRYDPSTRGFRCTETLSRGRVCTTENSDLPHDH